MLSEEEKQISYMVLINQFQSQIVYLAKDSLLRYFLLWQVPRKSGVRSFTWDSLLGYDYLSPTRFMKEPLSEKVTGTSLGCLGYHLDA